MAGKLVPSDDLKQLNGSAITSSSTNNYGGTAYALGSVPSDSQITARVGLGNLGASVPEGRMGADVFSVYAEDAVALTSVANNGSGKCRFTKNSHGLTVGTVLNITGSTTGNLDGLHVITAVATNTFDTNKDYVASADPGDYQVSDGTYNQNTEGNFLIWGNGTLSIAGGAAEVNSNGNSGANRAINKLEALRTVRTASAVRAGYWNSFTGAWTTKPTSADDIALIGADHVATPTRAVPGEFVYRKNGNRASGVVQADYSEVTS